MTKQITIINGPNLNLLGKREPEIYGQESFDNYYTQLQKNYPEIVFDYFQSNIEGELINQLQNKGFNTNGIILNAGGYTHTSVAIADTVAALSCPVIEVHISNIYARESERQVSLLSKHVTGMISGFGMESYRLAVEYLTKL